MSRTIFSAIGFLFMSLGLVALALCPARLFATEVAVVAESESNDTPGTGDTLDLTSGRVVATGSIGVGGDVDYYKITVPSNARVWALVDTGGPQDGGVDRDSILSLFATNGTTLLESDDDDGTGNGTDLFIESVLSSIIAGRQVSSGGTYYLQVKNSDDTGTISRYRLDVVLTSGPTEQEVEPNGDLSTATSLIAGTARIGARNAAIANTDDENEADDDVDYYSIAATPGDTVLVSVDGDPNRDGVQTNVAFDFLDAAGNVLLGVDGSRDLDSDNGSNDDGFIGEGAHLIVATNPVYVRVRGRYDPAEGSYRIMAATHAVPVPSGSLYTIPPCRILDTRTISNGAMVSSSRRIFWVGGLCGVPRTAAAAVFNVTVADPSGPGSLIIWPGNLPRPDTLTVSFPAGVTRSNNTVIGLSLDGNADIFAEGILTSGSTFHLVIDVTGYFVAD